MTGSGWTRARAAAGIPIVVAFVLILALTGNSPSESDSDQKILSYYASHGHRVRDLTVFFIALVGVAFFFWFLGHLHSILSSAEGESNLAATVAVVSGTAFVVLFAVAGSVFTAPSFVASDAGHKFALDPNTFRLLNGTAILVFIAAFAAAAPLPFTVGIVAWKARILPRWLAAASFLAGVACVVSFIFFPTFVYFAWLLLLSGYLALRPRTAPAPVAASGAP